MKVYNLCTEPKYVMTVGQHSAAFRPTKFKECVPQGENKANLLSS